MLLEEIKLHREKPETRRLNISWLLLFVWKRKSQTSTIRGEKIGGLSDRLTKHEGTNGFTLNV